MTLEGPSTSTATFNQTQQVQNSISTSNSRTLWSGTSSSPKDINSSYPFYGLSIRAELDDAPDSIQQYVNQRGKDNTINEVLFEKYQSDKVAWEDLACVRQSRVVWTDGKRSVAKDSGIDMGPESSAGAIEERNMKLNAYLPQNETNEDLTVFVGGPRRRLQHENEPFDWRTGHQRTQPPRLQQPEVPQTQPQTELIGASMQNTTLSSPLQMQQNSSGSHFQIPSLPINRFGSLVQNDGSPAASPDQIFSPPPNQAYTSPSLQSIYQPFHSIPPVQRYYASRTYPHTIFNQQADPANTPTNISHRNQDFGAFPPLAMQSGQHATTSADGLQMSPIIEQSTLAPYFENYWLPEVQYDPAEGSLLQDTWNNQDLSSFDSYAHGFEGPNDSMRNGYHNTMSPAQISWPYPDVLHMENDFTRTSGRQGTSPLSQTSSQVDGIPSAPSLSPSHSNAETASSLLNTPSSQGGMDPALYRPTYSIPPTDLNGVAAAMPENFGKMHPENGDPTNLLSEDDLWMKEFLSIPE